MNSRIVRTIPLLLGMAVLYQALYAPASAAADIGSLFDAAVDVGNPNVVGSTIYLGVDWYSCDGASDVLCDKYIMTAGGTNIWGSWDEFHYVYKNLSGDVRFSFKYEQNFFPQEWTMVGAMMRVGLQGNAVNFYTATRRGGDLVRFQSRDSVGGYTCGETYLRDDAPGDPRKPCRLGVQRVTVGGYVVVESLVDWGTGWQRVGSLKYGFTLPADVQLGVALTAHDPEGLSQAWLYDPQYELTPQLIGPVGPVVPAGAGLYEPCSDVPGFTIRSIKTRITDGWSYATMNELLDTGAVMGIPGYEEGQRIEEVVNLRDTGNGEFGNDSSFPGIDPFEHPAGDPAAGDDDNYFATEIRACIQLSKGPHIIGANSDEGAIIEIGGIEIGRTEEWKEASNVDFIFEVEASGYYRLRARTLEASGEANLELHEVAPDGTRILLGSTDADGDFIGSPVYAYVRILYVQADAPGENDGTSWENAFNYLQDALQIAQAGEYIRVAAGTYRPDQGAGIASGDREATFQLKRDVKIMGGYAGYGEPDADARDIAAYPTILSGDIGTPDDDTDNSYHVVTGSGTEPNAILDGFTITAGSADSRFQDDHGGGMLNNSGSPTVSNCVFSSNSSRVGGGMYNGLYSSPTVTNCRFINNSADYGGGMDNDLSSTTVVNCIFSGNTADAQFGGGMFIGGSSSCSVINCTFSSNSARVGGGMYNSSSSSLTLTNSIVWGNTASIKPQIYNGGTGSATVSYCDVQGGWPDESNIDADPQFKDADGPDDIVGTEDDDLRLLAGSPCIDAGDDDAITTSTDLDGRPRITDGDCDDTEIGDMGAYEFTSAYYGDFDGECDVDFIDYAILAGYWLADELLVDIAPTPAGDGIIDLQELSILAKDWLTGWVEYYNLTASVIGGNGSISPQSGTYPAGEVVTLQAPPAAGYKVKVWTGTDSDASTSSTNTVTMDTDKTVSVEFEAIDFSACLKILTNGVDYDWVYTYPGEHLVFDLRLEAGFNCNAYDIAFEVIGPSVGTLDIDHIAFPTSFDISGCVYYYEQGYAAMYAANILSPPVTGSSILIDNLIFHVEDFGETLIQVTVTGYTVVCGTEVPYSTVLDEVMIIAF